MTKDEKDDVRRAVEGLKAVPGIDALMREMDKRLEAARAFHEVVNDATIPGQHKWAQGKVAGINEIVSLLKGDFR